MVTPSNYTVGDTYYEAETYYGLSTDTKPTNVGNGSVFIEIDSFGKEDTPYIFCYDAENSEWYPKVISGD